MTEEELQAVLDQVQKNRKTCPRCNATEFFTTEVLSLKVEDEDKAHRLAGIVCARCGHLELRSLQVLL